MIDLKSGVYNWVGDNRVVVRCADDATVETHQVPFIPPRGDPGYVSYGTELNERCENGAVACPRGSACGG